MTAKTAVVVGALGVIGRYIVEKLASLPDWQVVGLSRRAAEPGERVRHISVDLTDARDAATKLAGLKEATHVFYAAFQPPAAGAGANAAANVAPNVDMLVNSVTAIDHASSRLERVVLVTGNKVYGSHLGPFRTPAREDDPRHMPPDFYFDQVDWLTAYQREQQQQGKRWSWTEIRPHTLCGFSPGTAMSILSVIAVYASISRHYGLPLRFPGKPGAFRAVYQVTESSHLANALHWAATEPRCANQAFNITNGDYFRWCNVWPKIAAVFEMPAGDVQTISLVQHMADKAPLWEELVRRHNLNPYRFDELVAWPFGDYVFGCDWDVMTSTVKARQFGFHDLVDSEEMFVRLLARFRAERIVP
jgi:nucleoside-diphosphate-sugar epimerase